MKRIAVWLAALGILLIYGRCAVEQPGVSSKYEQPQFQHATLTSSDTCTSCHETDRPAPFANTAHGGGKDCRVCHAPKDDNAGWLPRIDFNHVPKPASCLDCHIKERPASPPHPATGDCAGCHDYPVFKG